MKFTEKDIRLFRGISNVAGTFTMIVAFIMIFSLVQLKTINPLDNPALISVKDQYDKDPENTLKAEQVRAMDLMARKAYFATRRQVETGTYLLIAGAIAFVLFQRLIAGNEKIMPVIPGVKPDQISGSRKYRKYLAASAGVIMAGSLIASFILTNEMPDLAVQTEEKPLKISENRPKDNYKPDKTDYPFFRGQESRGIAGGSGYPVTWNGVDGTNIKWKIAMPKEGKSSPVIIGDKLFVTGADGTVCEVYCINKNTGEIVWTASASGLPGEPSALPAMSQESGLAVSTVAANSNSVCAIFSNGNLICLDHKGNKKWASNIGAPQSSYGYSSSLIIYNDILIVQYDSQVKLSLIGFDIATGKIKWETIRRGHPSWSSPVIGKFNGESQVIINGNPAVTAYDPSTGKELWTVDCMSGDVAPSVAVNSTMVYAVTDYAKLVAIRAGAGASIMWEDNTYTPDVSSPVATDEFLFIATGYGDVACYNSQSGDTLWTHYFMDQFYASPVIADQNVWLLNRSGTMYIIKAEGKFEQVAASSLGEPADCTPAFSDKCIYIRGKNNLYCISEN